jgi:hypothetical protein
MFRHYIAIFMVRSKCLVPSRAVSQQMHQLFIQFINYVW